MRSLLVLALAAALSGCTTIQNIVETQELLKEFHPPEGVVFTSIEVTSDGNDRLAGETMVRYRGGHQESPDLWSSLLAALFHNRAERWVEEYDVWSEGKNAYRVRVVQEISRPDNEEGEGISAMSVRLEVTGPDGKAIRVDRLVSTSHDRYLRFGAPLNATVSAYYNGLARRGGWSDLLRTPTALVVKQKNRILGLITEREPRRLMLVEPSTEVTVALLLADLEHNADHWE